MQLLLFAYAISFDVKNVPTVVLDQDRTAASRAYLADVPLLGLLRGEGLVDDLAGVDDAFHATSRRSPSWCRPASALARPRREGAGGGAGRRQRAELGAAGAGVRDRAQPDYGNEILVEWADRQGLDTRSSAGSKPRVRTWYNPERKSADFLIPGLMVVIIMIVTVQQTAMTLVRERDQGTQEQLIVSPLRQRELMVGKVLPWTLLAFVDMVVIALVGLWCSACRSAAASRSSPSRRLLRVRCLRSRADHLGARAEPRVREHHRAHDRVPAGVHPLGLRVPARVDPALPAGGELPVPGALHDRDLARGVPKGAGFAELWPQLALLAVYSVLVIAIASVLYGRRARR